MPPTSVKKAKTARKSSGCNEAPPAIMKAVTDIISPSVTIKPPLPSRPYTFNTLDASFVAYYTEAQVNYADVVFLVNGVLPRDGRRITVNKDCTTVTFERALHSRLFTKFTLKAILGVETQYKENDNRTVEYDNTTTQGMRRDGKVADTNGFYWGKEQVMILKEKCTGDPELSEHPYYNGLRVDGVRQYNTIFLCRLKLAEQRVSTEVSVKMKRAVDFGFGSQESGDGPPSPPARNYGSGSNKRGHVIDSPDAY
jgi:hypothetical protein